MYKKFRKKFLVILLFGILVSGSVFLASQNYFTNKNVRSIMLSILNYYENNIEDIIPQIEDIILTENYYKSYLLSDNSYVLIEGATRSIMNTDSEGTVNLGGQRVFYMSQIIDSWMVTVIIPENEMYSSRNFNSVFLLIILILLLSIIFLSVNKLIHKNIRPELGDNLLTLDNVLNSSCAGIIIKDHNNVVISWSKGAEQITGYSAGEILGYTYDKYVHKDTFDKIALINNQLQQGYGIPLMETDIVHKNGHIIHCATSYSPVVGLDKTYKGAIIIFHDSTEKKLAEKKERELGTLISASDAGIIIRDSSHIIRVWSMGAENILGYTSNEMIGCSLEKCFFGDMDRIIEIDENLVNGEHMPDYEVIRYHKSGHRINCLVSYTPIIDGNGKFDGSVIIFHDYTDRKKTEQEARRMAAIVQLADSAIIIKDKNGIIKEWNIGAENILGYTAEEMIGKTTHYYATEENQELIDSIQQRLEQGEHIAHVGVIRRHKDGHHINCSASYTPIYRDDGEFDGSVAIFHDVTYEKISEEKARKLAAIVAVADSGIVIKDKNGVVTEWNVGAENILGYTAEETIGRTSYDYSLTDSHHTIDEAEENLKKGIHTVRTEVTRRHKDGRIVYCSASYTPLYDEEGRFAGSVVIFHDISDKKQIEKQLYMAVLAAEEASNAKSTFLANMSHEIRTPMNGVIGLTDLALDDETISDKLRDYLEKIKVSAEGLLNIINDILDLSKVEAGKIVLENIPFRLQDIFTACETVSAVKAKEKGITLYFYAEPPAFRQIVGDPTKLRQVLLNLLSNAIKFTNKGMVKLLADITQINEKQVNIHFEVKDNGIGMTAEQIERVYDPFIQADSSTTRKYGGTGLGLPITKNFIEIMGGELKVESTYGVGSKFYFDLVFGISDSANGAYEERALPVSSVDRPAFTGDILVCEDSEINQQVIAEHLLKIGLNPTIASNGKEGLDEVKRRIENGNPFDLIFMDIHMPVMDGLDASNKLMEIGNKTPIVALTANVMAKDKEMFQLSGMSGYLAKPFVAKELWACLLEYLVPVSSEPVSAGSVINRELGLSQSAGDEALYNNILTGFVQRNKACIDELNLAIADKDFKLAHRIVHTLKSNAGLVGAEKLRAISEKTEKLLADSTVPEEHIEELDASLREAIAEISSWLEPEEPEINYSDEFDRDKALALISRLKPLLKKSNAKSKETISEIKEVFAAFKADRDLLIERIENYEYSQALEVLEDIEKQAF